MGRLPLVKPWAGELHDDDLLAPAVIKAGATRVGKGESQWAQRVQRFMI